MTERTATLADQAAAVAALALLVAGHRELPALNVGFNSIFPTELALSLHNQPGAFDAWMAAIAPKGAEVRESSQADGRTRVRRARFPYGGVEIQLDDYATSNEEAAS
jgi:hypothetical protein